MQPSAPGGCRCTSRVHAKHQPFSVRTCRFGFFLHAVEVLSDTEQPFPVRTDNRTSRPLSSLMYRPLWAAGSRPISLSLSKIPAHRSVGRDTLGPVRFVPVPRRREPVRRVIVGVPPVSAPVGAAFDVPDLDQRGHVADQARLVRGDVEGMVPPVMLRVVPAQIRAGIADAPLCSLCARTPMPGSGAAAPAAGSRPHHRRAVHDLPVAQPAA